MKFCTACGRGNPPESSACERCDAAFPVEEGELRIGQTLGADRYVVVAQLGQGGMGSVYRARDRRLDRDVAIKLLNHELVGHPTARARMEREAKALARLNHTNVVDIFDVMDHDGTLALVIEYVEGGTLTRRLVGGALPWRDALGFMDGILSGLKALHDEGIIHRDLKPDNVLIDPKGDIPKLTDLGVAHDAVGRGMTREGARLGTPEYMSPEQVCGGPLDARSDLYACGILLYEMLTGQVPFRDENDFQIYRAHVEHEPDWSCLPQDLPESIGSVLRHALAKPTEERPKSAEVMRQALLVASESGVQPRPQALLRAAPTAATPLVSQKLPKNRPVRPSSLTVPALVVSGGKDIGMCYPIDKDRVTVGRAATGDITLNDVAVSRAHFHIQRHGSTYRLTDLGSFNGTAVDAVRCSEATLREGMIIQVGKTSLIWRA
jgi:serine/threonine protein kinase